MRTSHHQFRMLVDAMNREGDISKNYDCHNNRIDNTKKWEELAARLNGLGDGYPRSVEKWKRVWADYKSNIKKKAARIRKSARAGENGESSSLKLTPLEEQVLLILHSASGVGEVDGAGIITVEVPPSSSSVSSTPPLLQPSCPPQHMIHMTVNPSPVSAPSSVLFIPPTTTVPVSTPLLDSCPEHLVQISSGPPTAMTPTPTQFTSAPSPAPAKDPVPSTTTRYTNKPLDGLKDLDYYNDKFVSAEKHAREIEKLKLKIEEELVEIKKKELIVRQKELEALQQQCEMQSNFQNQQLDLLEKLVENQEKQGKLLEAIAGALDIKPKF